MAGSECAGAITEVGAKVGFSVGDREVSAVRAGVCARETTATPPFQQVQRIPDEHYETGRSLQRRFSNEKLSARP